MYGIWGKLSTDKDMIVWGNAPVLKVDRGTIVKYKFGVIENSFPIPDTPLERMSGVAQTDTIGTHTLLQPLTSICVSSSDHFFRCFFSGCGCVWMMVEAEVEAIWPD